MHSYCMIVHHGEWDSAAQGLENLSTNSRSVFKPSYKNYHIKASNNAVIQNVSIFAIGYAEHFVAKVAVICPLLTPTLTLEQEHWLLMDLEACIFNQDDTAYISHVIPPQRSL